jgi:hypothetical protein
MKKSLLISGLFALSCVTALSQTIPNGGFENWNTINYDEPDSVWITSNSESIVRENVATVSQVTGVSGKAVHIQTVITGTDTLESYISNSPDPIDGVGGVPYSQKPTNITGYYRYNLPGNDSAILIVTFKKSGVVISTDLFMIGGSQATFTPFSFPLTVSIVPDTVIIAATSSNFLTLAGINNGSWLELDSLAFTGTAITQDIPDGSFETWSSASFEQAAGWAIQPANNDLAGITKTTDHYNGSYAIKLVTELVTGSSSGLLYSSIANGQQTQALGLYGGQPFTLMTDTLTGYYKYITPGNDSGMVDILLKNNGNDIDNILFNLAPQANYTYFEVPIAASSIPDTMLIAFFSSCWSYLFSSLSAPGSTLYLDNLQLKSQMPPPAGVKEINNSPKLINVYPNPAGDVLNFDLRNNTNGDINIAVYDMTGRMQMEKAYPNPAPLISIPVNALAPGMYLYKVSGNNINITNKFLKE